MTLFSRKRFPSPTPETQTKRSSRTPLLGLVVLVLLFGLSERASAQKVIYENAQPGICAACTQFGDKCCARQPSVAACIKCGGARYDLDVQTRWCQTNQPVCARKSR